MNLGVKMAVISDKNRTRIAVKPLETNKSQPCDFGCDFKCENACYFLFCTSKRNPLNEFTGCFNSSLLGWF